MFGKSNHLIKFAFLFFAVVCQFNLILAESSSEVFFKPFSITVKILKSTTINIYNVADLNLVNNKTSFQETINDLQSFKVNGDQSLLSLNYLSGSKFYNQSGQEINFKNVENIVVSVGRKTPATIVFLHGLYGDAFQFEQEAAKFAQLGFNSILVTLPGHGGFAKESWKTKYTEWLEATRQAAQLALKLGDKIIFYGQSTGGLLAFWYSSEFPDHVLTQILLEPAFRVKKDIVSGSCFTGSFIKDARGLNWITEPILGLNLSDNAEVSPNLGCEVSKLSEFVFPKIETNKIKNKYESFEKVRSSKQTFDYKIDLETRLKDIKTPTLISYIEEDKIVVPQVFIKIKNQIDLHNSEYKNYEINQLSYSNDKKYNEHGWTVQALLTYKFTIYDHLQFNNKDQYVFNHLVKVPSLKDYMVNAFNFNRLTPTFAQLQKIFLSPEELDKYINELNSILDLNRLTQLMLDPNSIFIEKTLEVFTLYKEYNEDNIRDACMHYAVTPKGVAGTCLLIDAIKDLLSRSASEKLAKDAQVLELHTNQKLFSDLFDIKQGQLSADKKASLCLKFVYDLTNEKCKFPKYITKKILTQLTEKPEMKENVLQYLAEAREEMPLSLPMLPF